MLSDPVVAPAPAAAPATGPTLIGSVRRALTLLEVVAEYGEVTAKRLSRLTGTPLGTTYHLLRTLVHEGYLQRERGVFRLGGAAHRLTGPGPRDDRRETRLPEWLRVLHTELDAPVYYGVLDGGEIELVAYADSPERPAVQQWADFRTTGHAHALGQCLLAQSEPDVRRAYLARRPVTRLTSRTVADEEALMRRLAGVRRGAPVFESEEYVLGTVCAAVPIAIGGVRSAIAVSLPAAEADRLRTVAAGLQERLERTLVTQAFTVTV